MDVLILGGAAAGAAGAAGWYWRRTTAVRRERALWDRLFRLYAAPAAGLGGGVGVPELPGALVWVGADGLRVEQGAQAALVGWPHIRQVHALGPDGLQLAVEDVGVLALPGRIGHDVWEAMTAGHHGALRTARA